MHADKINDIESMNNYELTEQDFYPPEDTRLYTSGIDDVNDGDSFAEYAEYFWDTYEDELFDCNN